MCDALREVVDATEAPKTVPIERTSQWKNIAVDSGQDKERGVPKWRAEPKTNEWAIDCNTHVAGVADVGCREPPFKFESLAS